MCINALLLGLPKSKLKRIQLAQNAAARLIKGLRKNDHITPVLKDMHWLPIEQRILKILVLTFKFIHGQSPQYLIELLQPYNPVRALRSSDKLLSTVPKSKYVETSKHAFGIRAPMEWNNLPFEIRNKESVNSFNSALKTYLCRLVYNYLCDRLVAISDYPVVAISVIFILAILFVLIYVYNICHVLHFSSQKYCIVLFGL